MINYILRRKWVGNPTTLKIANFSEKVTVHSTNDGDPPNAEGGYVFRWATTSTIPGNCVTVNSAKAIHKVYDKRDSRKVFSDKGMAPKSWISYENFLSDGGDQAILSGGLVIVRPRHHFRGQDMFLCDNNLKVYQATQQNVMKDGYYISTYIKKIREYRAFVVSGRVIGLCQKIPVDADAVSWGCADEEGGAFKYINWSQWNTTIAKLAVDAQREMKIDFAAVDIIEDVNGKFYLLELNSGPSMSNYWAECFAKSFDYIVQNGKEFINVGTDNSWKSYIHPALTDQAKVA